MEIQYFIALLLGTVAAIQLGLGILIFQRNKTNRINITFLLLMICLALWSILMPAAYCFSFFSSAVALFLTRLLTVPAFFFPSIFLYLTKIFPENTYKNKAAFFAFHATFILLLLSFLFSDYYIKSSQIVPGGIDFKFGIIYIVFGIYLAATMAYGCYELLKKLTFLKGAQRYQVLLFMAGAIISLILGMIFAFILPAFNIYFNFLAPASTLFCIGFLTQAIIKTRFMDIRVAINRLTAYFILIVIYLLLGAFSLFVYSRFLSFELNFLTVVFLATLLFLGSSIYHPLRLHLQTTPDRFLFREKYLYEQAIKELGEKSGSIVELNELEETFCQKIREILRSDDATIYML
ncbi:hypothetical protein A2276_06360 [candidate division WOR-1 bacterium RIFOXYA12_FULL_43_27]|uniref:Histidine kinase N-terminal 7TM region domain-containing protein n=1 Tax=candidate division WOR-1 bacterium RIFOXYC2_FULL_46_14 TaxID=1802587 RepID=A0A1F4U5B2_UNCSA|nr:MAG: hypothetical protein A2276_06360 [candidate division WOR-1 bacterium RIFOXYA12_FULL_43_27]OGC20275.1 MAG: hypothetical protein A2292_04360 [candidate division WOR-1 bacterium RIFOXYB2_FULL_46_45]OGC31988.1 MAG: hypothetical protein A2232_07090 [candidate division WOR-1 bacterium RIFOXYA2_FULL_46_56]OGC40122.1 MAG: hypothetical protein A2438_02380 [candidate division WOR-1 bacterium RIFOXYC2_FULL_46_14]